MVDREQKFFGSDKPVFATRAAGTPAAKPLPLEPIIRGIARAFAIERERQDVRIARLENEVKALILDARSELADLRDQRDALKRQIEEIKPKQLRALP